MHKKFILNIQFLYTRSLTSDNKTCTTFLIHGSTYLVNQSLTVLMHYTLSLWKHSLNHFILHCLKKTWWQIKIKAGKYFACTSWPCSHLSFVQNAANLLFINHATFFFWKSLLVYLVVAPHVKLFSVIQSSKVVLKWGRREESWVSIWAVLWMTLLSRRPKNKDVFMQRTERLLAIICWKYVSILQYLRV